MFIKKLEESQLDKILEKLAGVFPEEVLQEIKDSFGFETEILNLGGGFGVRYTENEPEIDYEEKIREVAPI